MRWLLIALLFCACRAPASQLSPGTVVSYGVGHFEGSVSFSVNADGTAEYSSTGDPSGPIEARAKVTPEELRELARVLRENDFCGLRSTRSIGVLDEASPSVAVRLEDIDCEVEMWDGEWRDDPEAKACLDAVEGLGNKIRKRGAPPSKSGLPEGELLRYGVNHREVPKRARVSRRWKSWRSKSRSVRSAEQRVETGTHHFADAALSRAIGAVAGQRSP